MTSEFIKRRTPTNMGESHLTGEVLESEFPRLSSHSPTESIQRKLEFGEEDTDDIFALDEDTKTFEFSGNAKKHFTDDFDTNSGDSSDEFSESDKGNRTFSASSRLPPRSRHSGRGGPLPNTSARLPSSSIAASLPVKISNGFWPPREAIDSLPDEQSDIETGVERDFDGRPRAKTILPQREDDIFRNIQAYSRSIQPADDPERLFGERPRRRYRTGEQSGEDASEIKTQVASSLFSAAYNTSAGGILTMPVVVANDLNLVGESGTTSGFAVGIGSTSNTPRASPRVIIPSSLSGHY